MKAFFIATNIILSETMLMNFKEQLEFTKEFKQLAKKYRSLPDDLGEFKQVIAIAPLGSSKHFTAITKNERCAIVKARLFCRYLKGSSLRIIYAFHFQSGQVDFIELYFKGEKENEDRRRIEEYLKNYS